MLMLCLLSLLLVIPGAAQTPVAHSHLRYRLIDLGTLGGPNSAEGVVFPFINGTGTVVGFSDTTMPDPFNPGGFIPHAFRWSKGVLTDLGTLPGGSGSFAVWSNNQGQVVGLSDDGHTDPVLGGPEGFATLWDKNGQALNLGTFGGTQSLAGSINERGQVVGVAASTVPDPYSLFGWATETRGFVWEKGHMRDLGTLGGPDTSPSFINERGQIAGNSYVNLDPPPDAFLCGFPIVTHPFFWENGTMVDLGTLGGTCATAVTINNRGQVTGTSNMPGDQILHPFLWDRGELTDLGTFGGTFGVANWMNDAGEIVGVASTEGDEEFHGFFWKNGVMRDIGTVQEDVCSIPHFVNARGQVVGTSGCTDEGFEVHGFIWQPGGSIIDLNDFVPPNSDLRVTDGETINDRGEIAGSGLLPNGDFHAVVLIPCDADHGESDGCQDVNPSSNKSSLSQTKTHVLSNRQQFDAREIIRGLIHGNRRKHPGLRGN
jgi:probable HAF family extracellular repeat protein